MSKRFYLVFALVLIAAALLSACGAPAATDAAATEAAVATTDEQSAEAAAAGASGGVLTLGEQSMPTFTRNFNPLTPNSPLPGAINLIHEPLMIYNSVTGEIVPWLATEYAWSEDLKTLTFTIRDGVKWSDGEPFTAGDVAFTFNLLKNAPGVSSTVLSALVGDSAYVDTITAPDDQTVQFTFKTVYTPGVYELINQNIVPEHIWQDVTDVVAFTNETPVGTGPFTEVVNFTPQAYQIDKNPNYWQEGKPAFQSVVYKAFADANAASLAMVDGEIDWSNYRLTDPQNEFVSKDAANRYFINSEGPNMAILAMNIGRPPFDDVNVRKAISMAINREQVAMIGEGGVVQPADVTGLTSLYTPWKVSDPAALGDWATYNIDKANELLDAAGMTLGADGIRVTPDGTPMRYTVAVLPAPNWLADLQVAAENLKEVGIELTVQPQPNYPEWVGAQQTGNFDMLFSIIDGNATPYRFYRMTMSSDLLQPEGTAAQGNYTRYADGKADDLLQQFAAATDPAQQKEIAQELQAVFAEEVPAVPLVPLGGMGLVNTSRLTGFPTADNYYASAEPNPSFFADWLLVLTQLQPK